MNTTEIIAGENSQELFVIREFDAARELLFEAFINPDLLPQWMGNEFSDMQVEKLDARVHGSWRFVHTDKAGNKYGFNGVIHQFLKPICIIRTFEFEGINGSENVQLEFINFDELPYNRSKLTIQTIYKTVSQRDFMLRRGMDKGANMAHNRLQELLHKLKLQHDEN